MRESPTRVVGFVFENTMYCPARRYKLHSLESEHWVPIPLLYTDELKYIKRKKKIFYERKRSGVIKDWVERGC